MPNNIKYLYASLLLAILLLAGSAIWLVGSVLTESQGIDKTPRDTLIGVAAQTSHELKELIYALDDFSEPEPKISKKILMNKFDILWSREMTNTSGSVGHAFAKLDGVPHALAALKDILRDTEDQIINLQPSDAVTAKKISARYKDLSDEIYNIWRISSKHVIKQTSNLYAQFESVSYWTTILIILICITSCLVTLIIWKERQALRNLNKHLEERVEERTKDLRRTNQIILKDAQERKSLEEKLIQSQKMEIVGQLTGGIAHDFNNLLAIIQGNAELLLEYVGDRDRKLVEPILRSTQRGSDLTGRLLAFSRKQALKPETIDVGSLVCKMTELLDRSLGETISVKLNTPNDLWHALVDPSQLENAVLNLAVNARQAMPTGGTVSIETRNETILNGPLILSQQLIPGDYLCLLVTDNGTGMSDDVRVHAFEPFFTTKETGKGSGLGLSMVYGFAQQSGGFVDIFSKLGDGTTVKIYLPRSLDDITVSAGDTQETKTQIGNGELIFVLEDDPEVLAMSQKLLTALNYDVITATNVQDARQILKQNPSIKIILSDVILPGGQTGPEFLTENRDLVGDAKILFMSGYPADATQPNTQSPNWSLNNILLNKPFKMAKLAAQLHACLHENDGTNKKA